MKKQSVLTAVAMVATQSLAIPALAQSDGQPIYGSQLMSDQERAREQGMTLPETPPARGMGQGQGMGMGQGQGSGGRNN